jgi:hypothetical protein
VGLLEAGKREGGGAGGENNAELRGFYSGRRGDTRRLGAETIWGGLGRWIRVVLSLLYSGGFVKP